MSKATILTEMINSFSVRPLDNEQNLGDFYVSTVQARDANPTMKLQSLLKYDNTDDMKLLFIGHTGSGKSTELFKMANALEEQFIVVSFCIDSYVDCINLSYVDMLFMMLENLVETVKANNINISSDTLENIYHYWNDEEVSTFTEEEKAEIETTATAGASFLNILSAKIKSFLQLSSNVKNEIKRKIEPSVSQLIAYMNDFIANIKKEIHGKRILMIIDNLDKLDLKKAEEIFIDHCKLITSLNINIVYTFPIFMYYSKNFMYIRPYFNDAFLLSMIKVKTPDGNKNPSGIEALQKIVEKRAELELFEEGVLDFAIEKSGGCIRSLVNMIRNAALEADARYNMQETLVEVECQKIEIEDMKKAYSSYRSSMERIIRKEHLDTLKEIYENKSPIISGDDVVRDLLMTLAVIEYNGKRWYDLNPAIEDYLLEIGELKPRG